MRRILVLAGLSACAVLAAAQSTKGSCPQGAYLSYVGKSFTCVSVPLPDHKLTPGLAEPTLTEAKLCAPSFHTGTVRNVPLSEKKSVCAAYGIKSGCPGPGYELDHLISIELGGSNDAKNLWPQPVDSPGVIGYHTKDVVENRAHRAVCAGTLTLQQAQRGIADNWYTFGVKNGFITKSAK